MSKALFTEAQRVAQEFDLEVIPCGDRKQPLEKGWRELATREPVERSFRGATYVGVPAGLGNDLIVFDLDYYKRDADGVPQPASNEVWDRLADFEEELTAAYPGCVRIHKTQSGGVHLIMRYPEGAKIARNPMPNMEVIMEGFQFIWPTEGSGYTVEEDVPLEDLASPGAEFLMVRYKAAGMSTGAGLMTSEKAHEVMMTDGGIGTRHDALLRVTQDLVAELEDDHLRAMTDAQIGELIEQHLQKLYGPFLSTDRAAQLFEIRSERDGTLSGGELGNALKGPLKNRRAMTGDRLAALGAAQLAKSPPLIMAVAPEREEAAAERKAEAAIEEVGEFLKIDIEELKTRELDDIDWIVDSLIPAGNLISITGPSGAGKTRFVAALVAALSSGRTDLIGLPRAMRKITTLWCANEELGEDVERRVKAAALLNGLSGDLKLLVRGKENGQFKLAADGSANTPATDHLIKAIKERGVELVVFDPFVTLGVLEENDASSVDTVISEMHRISIESGAAVMFIHHTPKDRSAPDDELRGNSGAWRGSGAIYSSLDMGLTLMPYLPPACHAAKDGKANRAALKRAQAAKQVAKYIVLDPTKERESEPLTPVYFRLDGVQVKQGGRPVGAITPVLESSARQACEKVLVEMSDHDVDTATRMAWVSALLKVWPDEGRHEVQICDLVKALDEAMPIGWTASKDTKARASQGAGKRIIDVLTGEITKVGKVMVHAVRVGRLTVLVVAK